MITPETAADMMRLLLERNAEDEEDSHIDADEAMKCPNCGKAADPTYRPLTTRYPDAQEL